MFLETKNIPEDFPLDRIDRLISAVDSLLDEGKVPAYLHKEVLWWLEGLLEGHNSIEHVIANADDEVKGIFAETYIEIINKENDGKVSQKEEIELELAKYENLKKWRISHINNMKRLVDQGELAKTEIEKTILLSVSLKQAADIKGVDLYTYQYFLSALIGKMELISKLTKVMSNGKLKAITGLTSKQLELVGKFFEDGKMANS